MKNITRARSKKNGIVFYSNTMPELAVDAFVDEDGKIQTIVTLELFTDFIDFIIEEERDSRKPHFNKAITFFIKVFLIVAVTVLFRNIYVSMTVLYITIFSSYWFATALSAFDLKLGKRKCSARFHSAEHMVINAYKKFQRIPTLEEIKQCSRFSENCGSMTVLNKAVTSFLFTLCVAIGIFVDPLVYIVVVIFIFIFCLVLEKFSLLKYLQFLFTSKPTDLELNVALAGIQAYDDMEKQLKQGEIQAFTSDHFSIHYFL